MVAGQEDDSFDPFVTSVRDFAQAMFSPPSASEIVTSGVNQVNVKDTVVFEDSHKRAFNMLKRFSLIIEKRIHKLEAFCTRLRLPLSSAGTLTDLADTLVPARATAYLSHEERSAATSAVNELKFVQAERRTWDLVVSLLEDRIGSDFPKAGVEAVGDSEAGGWPVPLSEDAAAYAAFVDMDRPARDMKIVRQWLERSSGKVRFSEENVTLHNTLQRLLSGSPGKGDLATLVTNLDPDAPSRQEGLRLDASDEDVEKILLKNVFLMHRAGRPDLARKLCRACGQPWRAASIAGGDLWRQRDEDSDQEARGNPHRQLWRRMCGQVARKADYVWERGLYGLFAGIEEYALGCCETWEDCLWAHVVMVIDEQIDLLTAPLQKPESEDSADLGAKEAEKPEARTWETIFETLRVSVDPVVAAGSNDYIRQVQVALILDKPQAVMALLRAWVNSVEVQPQGLSNTGLFDGARAVMRFAAHLALVLNAVGLVTLAEASDVVSQYCDQLIEDRVDDVVALYAASLPRALGGVVVGRFLCRANSESDKRRFIKLISDAGIDPREAARAAVLGVRERVGSGAADDDSLVRALEWLALQEDQRAEVVVEGNALGRALLLKENFVAAARVFEEVIPPDAADKIKESWGDAEAPAVEVNAVKELNCLCLLVSCFRGFAQFRSLIGGAAELSEGEWTGDLGTVAEAIERRIYSVLKYECGWLVDIAPVPDLAEAAVRTRELDSLRRLVLPQLVFMLISVMEECGQYAKCLQIADVVADPHYAFVEIMTPDDVGRMLQTLGKCAATLIGVTERDGKG